MKTMKRMICVTLVMALCLCAAGCGKLPFGNVSPDDITSQPSDKSPYDAIITNYETAVTYGLDEAQMTEKGLNGMISRCLDQDERAQVGYYVGDLNGDGQEELAIAASSESEYYTGLIFALYTVRDGEAVPLVISGERDRWYYAGEGQLYNVASSSAMESENCLCTADEELTYLDGVEYNAAMNADNPWLHFTGEAWEYVTEEEAEAFIVKMEYHVTNLEIIPFQ